MEENKVVENVEVAQTPQVEAVKPERISNAMNPTIVKMTKNMLVLSILILCIMAIRMFSSLGSLSTIELFLQQTDKKLVTMGILLIVEIVFMVINLAIAITSFVMLSNWKNSVMKDSQTDKQYKSLKVINLIMSILFTVFVVFEFVSVILSLKIALDLGAEINIVTMVMSVVWTAIYAVIAWVIYSHQQKINKELK